MKTTALVFLGLMLAACPALADTVNSTSGAGAAASTNVAIVTNGGRIPKGVPSAIAPGLTASAVETCMGSASAGGSGAGWGFSIGTTYNDNGCEARLDARTLWSFGERGAALNRLCERPKIRQALFQAGRPCPGDEARAVAIITRRSSPLPAGGDVRTINGVQQVYRTR